MNTTFSATIERLRVDSHRELQQCATLEDVDTVRIKFLGRNGLFSALMEQLSTMSLEEKREYGPLLNETKKNVMAAIERKKDATNAAAAEKAAESARLFDVTAQAELPRRGSLHILTQALERIEDIFISMGFDKVEGPELETDFYNFQALNIPEDHPARDMHDTFWLTLPHYLMRTHTSSVEIRAMQSMRPPLAIFSAGRVYRNEATDATHDYLFMQCECLFIDKNVSLGNLLATLRHFFQAFFENPDLEIRVRPSYFPFTEPSLEVDISCLFCNNGCSICKHSGWIEVCGAGLTHPHVLRSCNLDPKVYQGFALGMGIERLVMLKHGITDIRLLRSNKIEFLEQF